LHCADVDLAPDEQVTFISESGSEYDVVRKAWGYYATPSLNRRLPDHGLRPALVRSGEATYLLLVEQGAVSAFHAYLESQNMEVILWLDGPVDALPRSEGS
jgi:hypothetical protein